MKIGVWNGWLFMSVFLLQMLVVPLAGKGIWEKTHVPAGFKRTRIEKYSGIAGNLIWLIAMGYSIVLPFRLSTVWFYCGLGVFIIGFAVMAVSTVNFIVTPADRLIVKGAYAFSRNPMYLATFLICLGSGLAAGSGLFLFLSVLLFLCFHQEVLVEEKYCLDTYGDSYREYLNRAPRWLGVPGRARGGER
jgi:protein-S-isoprenylcysteine O-methyltransferase Ste14